MAAAEPETSRETAEAPNSRLVYRQKLATRLTHWLWAFSLFFLLLSGLQIFNAHPALYLGDQSGFEFDNSVLRIGAEDRGGDTVGYTKVLGFQMETTGLLGFSGEPGALQARAFPSWATIPSGRDLASGRVVHFFFAWLFFAALLIWLLASAVNGHLRRDVIPGRADFRQVGRDLADHVRLRFYHRRRYGPLQKFSYALVLLGLFPLMILSGLAMSPGINAAAPFLAEILGGRQTARTLHFLGMVLIVLFFVVHIAMVVAAGPLNEMRSMITGWYRADASDDERPSKREPK
ncbi:MAG: cytochrome b/b6 domain-containing protein [Aquamicrobium sp.]|nr:cytochrome b/b6 domain-containing protein [Aquamicrobium sp.]